MKFQARAITIREFETLTIIFKDGESIWLIPKDASTTIVFNRWFAPKGSYSNGWQDFRRKLFRNKRITLEYAYRLAIRYRIQSMGTTRSPNLDNQNIEHQIVKLKQRRSK